MNRSDKLFCAAALIPVGMLVFETLYGFIGKVDDWCFTNFWVSRQTLLLLTAVGIALIPRLARLLQAAVTWFFSARYAIIKSIAFILAILTLAAISIPNFRKAREGGFAVGGAKDINAFRLNISEGLLPQESDITHHGLFYDYSFNAREAVLEKDAEQPSGSSSADLFTPACSWAVLKDPLSANLDTFVSIGLRSRLDTTGIGRKKLNLVVVLDISGSMSSGFRSYYYDQFLPEKDRAAREAERDEGGSKMQVAARSIVAMMGMLKDDDRFGMVLFNGNAYVAKPLRPVGQTHMDAIKRHIFEIRAFGGTFMEGGMRLGRSLLSGLENSDPEEFENRIIFLTDAMPNIGMTSRDGLFELAQKYAAEHVYTTFIGVGIDFQTELAEFITQIRGANYYAIHSAWEFKKRLANEFVYMVTPLLFNLRVTLHSDTFSIEEVYGSPEADQATGLLMKVNTLFPAPVEDGAVKGGIILLRLKRNGTGNDLRLTASYEDRSGKVHQTTVSAPAPDGSGEYCSLPDVRKAVVLARLVNLMKEWIRSERGAPDGRPENEGGSPNYWEHTSDPLKISDRKLAEVKAFRDYFVAEANLIGDPDMGREKDLLDTIIEKARIAGQPAK